MGQVPCRVSGHNDENSPAPAPSSLLALAESHTVIECQARKPQHIRLARKLAKGLRSSAGRNRRERDAHDLAALISTAN